MILQDTITMSILRLFSLFVGVVTISAAFAAISVIAFTPARHPEVAPVTAEELEKTKLVLDFAERNCKKLGFRVEGSGAYISVACGTR